MVLPCRSPSSYGMHEYHGVRGTTLLESLPESIILKPALLQGISMQLPPIADRHFNQ
jgi:hypothetical protein